MSVALRGWRNSSLASVVVDIDSFRHSSGAIAGSTCRPKSSLKAQPCEGGKVRRNMEFIARVVVHACNHYGEIGDTQRFITFTGLA